MSAPSAYVIDTLDAALWAVWSTGTFRDAVLVAANLGDDAAGVAAVAGQMAGALYGGRANPAEWRSGIAWSETIGKIAASLSRAGASVS